MEATLTQIELEELQQQLYGWITRDVIAGMFLGIAALFMVLGLVYVFARPRAIGVAFTMGMVWLILHTWMWYAIPYMQGGQAVMFVALIVSMALLTSLILWLSWAETARETGQQRALRIIGSGTLLLGLYHIVSMWVWLRLNPPQPVPHYAWFLLPTLLVAGVACIAGGVVFAFIKRARTKAPYRPTEMP